MYRRNVLLGVGILAVLAFDMFCLVELHALGMLALAEGILAYIGQAYLCLFIYANTKAGVKPKINVSEDPPRIFKELFEDPDCEDAV